jgi:hypothetical protein
VRKPPFPPDIESRQVQVHFVAVKDLTAFDVLLSGSVVLGVDLIGETDYAEVTVRKNDSRGIGQIDRRRLHVSTQVYVQI